jgi:O-antigen ligase
MQGSPSDSNSDSRLALATAGLQSFAASPLLGSGLGASTNDWPMQEGSHNLYVTHLAEHGILGGLLFPALLLLLAHRARSSNAPGGAIALVVFLGLWGLFSHNVLDEFHSLLAIGLGLASASARRGRSAAASRPVARQASPVVRLLSLRLARLVR